MIQFCLDVTELETRKGETAFVEEATKLLRRIPDLTLRRLYLDRRYDILCYLLSEERRNGVTDPAEMVDPLSHAIYGAVELHPGIHATQGAPIRLTPSASVSKIAAALAPIHWSEICKWIDPARMEAAGVYKAFNRPGEAEWIGKWVRADTDSLIGFYQDCATHGFQVLVVLD